MKLVSILGLIFVSVFSAHADLYVPGAFLSGNLPVSDYMLGSSTEPNWGGYGAGVYLETDEIDPFLSILTVNNVYYGTGGIGHIWYETTEDTLIDSAFVAATTPFFDMSDYSHIGQIEMETYQPFLMAFYLEGGVNGVYGWAELMYDGSALHLLDSAAENDGVGIIAGKYEQVPEPATILLFGIGGVGAWLLRRNGKHAPKLT